MDDKTAEIKKLLDDATAKLSQALKLLDNPAVNAGSNTSNNTEASSTPAIVGSENVITGTFNGEEMVAADGRNYPVPANYASKSKLVEGDGLKLTIATDGSFVYKQIDPVERRNVVGTLTQTSDGYGISAEGKEYRVLTASVTFYKAEPGDTVTGVVASNAENTWAAFENIVKKADMAGTEPAETSPDTQPQTPEPVVVPDLGGETVITTPGMPMTPEPATAAPAEEIKSEEPSLAEPVKTPDAGPEIILPANQTGLTDEEMLKNLQANLKSIGDTPETTSKMDAVQPPVVVTTPEPPKQTADQPITELDI